MKPYAYILRRKRPPFLQLPICSVRVGELTTKLPKIGHPLKENFILKTAYSNSVNRKKVTISKANGVVMGIAFDNANKTKESQLFLLHSIQESPYYIMSNIKGDIVSFESADGTGVIIRSNTTWANIFFINYIDVDAIISVANV